VARLHGAARAPGRRAPGCGDVERAELAGAAPAGRRALGRSPAEFRGWSDAAWSLAAQQAARLPEGTAERLEVATDVAAAQAYSAMDPEALLALLAPLAESVQAAGDIPFPNAMGLPAISRR
jgi:hypothetical protein